jgi:hypothetical protein
MIILARRIAANIAKLPELLRKPIRNRGQATRIGEKAKPPAPADRRLCCMRR